MLWGSMLHPPSSFKGPQHQYRTADGSHNSILYPELGKAGLPYAKSIQPQRPVNGAKPDIGDIFDILMAREGDGRVSESGISSLLLYNATIIIHDVFRTNDDDRNVSDTSSYLDLSPLYGKDAEAQSAVRTFKDGLLKRDTFAEHRLLNQPPGVCIYLIMYNRFHNYVAQQLKEINENGKFGRPDFYGKLDKDDQAKVEQKIDEDLFQTARLITCGLYIQIAIHDYLRVLMGIHAKDSSWTLDPRREYSSFIDKETVSRGQGNMVSVEFNLLYRFHAPLSHRDASWSTDLFTMFLHGQKMPDGTPITDDMVKNGEVPARVMGTILRGLNAAYAAKADDRKTAKYFPDGFDRVGGKNGDCVFTRNADGYFDDAQMVAEMVRVIEDPMCSFGANQVPKVFKSIELLGLLRARGWEVCTLNEFRRFFKMPVHTKFEDINSDPVIQAKLRDLYVDVDSVELYPGYLCEGQGQNADPGVTCPNGDTALWRGIFSDAVTLVRSDRFYTTEWNVDSLTGYGMRELTSDKDINKGGFLFKLFHRAFPGYFKFNSLHLWQPYYTPAKNLQLAYAQGKLKDMDFEDLEYQFVEDKDQNKWTPLALERDAATGDVKSAFFDKLKKSGNGNSLRVRRQLIVADKDLPLTFGWRGIEKASKITKTNLVIGDYEGAKDQEEDLGDYATIQTEILGGVTAAQWKNPAIVTGYDIPKGPFREIMTYNFDPERWGLAMKTLGDVVGMNGKLLDATDFRKYFEGVASDIREREQRSFQKVAEGQVFQLDVVSDYAIPVITRFVADWLGFWDRVKSVEYPDREFSENQIYQHLDNCQDYQSWDADQTKSMKRRQLFKTSILELKKLADDGVIKYSAGVLSWRNWVRSYGGSSDSSEVKDVRKMAVQSTQALLAKGFSYEEVAGLMLDFALDSVHKLVLDFTEILAFFIDPVDPATLKPRLRNDPEMAKHTKLWREVQILAMNKNKDPTADEQLVKYILEAQRLTQTLNLARQYVGPGSTKIQTTVNGVETVSMVKPNDVVLLDVSAANRNSKVFPSPDEFNVNRPRSKYLIYGDAIDHDGVRHGASFGKELSLAYLTAMIKHLATRRCVRVAHDNLGRLKRVTLPGGLPGYPAKANTLQRYVSPQWDALLSFPASWELRYTGEYDNTGEGVYTAGDNANQGHGLDLVWQDDSLSGGIVKVKLLSEEEKLAKQKKLDEEKKLADQKKLEEAKKLVEEAQKLEEAGKQEPYVVGGATKTPGMAVSVTEIDVGRTPATPGW